MRPFNEYTEVVTKDSENEGPIPSAWRPTLKNIVDAFVRHDCRLADGVAGVAPVSEKTATQIRTIFSEFTDAVPRDIPVGTSRLSWSPKALLATDERLATVEARFRTQLLAECIEIMRRYG